MENVFDDSSTSGEDDSNSNKFVMGGGNDTVIDSGGDDILNMGSGNDSVRGGAGSDTIYGGDGTDRLDYFHNSSGGLDFTVSATKVDQNVYTDTENTSTINMYQIVDDGNGNVEYFAGIETLVASPHSDVIDR